MKAPEGSKLPQVFWSKVEPDEHGCWIWIGYVNPSGYGLTRHYAGGRGKTGVHRAVYIDQVGPIPAGLHTDHLCRVRHCVNPAHIEPVTPRENTMRGDTLAADQVKRTHCPSGHPYDEANTYRIPSRPRARYCLACRQEYYRTRNHARRLR